MQEYVCDFHVCPRSALEQCAAFILEVSDSDAPISDPEFLKGQTTGNWLVISLKSLLAGVVNAFAKALKISASLSSGVCVHADGQTKLGF